MIKTKEQVEEQRRPFTPRQSFRQVVDAAIARQARRWQEREAQKQYQNLLPEDFSGQILIRAKAEAQKIQARLVEIDAEIARIAGEIADGKVRERELCPRLLSPARRVGDIFGEFEIIPARPDPRGGRVLSPAALQVRRNRGALTKHLRRLELEKSDKQSELRTLRRICELAATSDVAVVSFLSGEWTKRLVVGFGLLANLPQAARLMNPVPCDQFGNTL